MKKRYVQKVLALAAGAALACGACADVATVTIDTGAAKGKAAPDLWGLFFEDIDLSLDGGVYAEMVRNRSFEDFNGRKNELTLEYWNPVGNAEYFLSKKSNAHTNDQHCVTVRGYDGAGIANEGYFGMGVAAGAEYNFTMAIKGDFARAEVALEAYGKPVAAKATIEGIGGEEWKTVDAKLAASITDPQCRLVIRLFTTSRGGRKIHEAQIDHVSLFPADAVAGLFRRDLVEKLAALNPSFVRFPGGCWVEGETMKEAYRWKTTIGDMWERRTQWNIWKYWSTNGVGFHEYLLLAEALNAKPLFCINVGMSHKETVPMDKMGEFVQDALDCIEYCNGDERTFWGAKRAAAGHPAPFNLRYLEIGNENGGPEYEERYKLIADAVAAKYPDVTLIFDNWKETKAIKNGARADLRDDHFYKTPDHFMGPLAHEYDTPKGDFGVFVGEYAVIKDTTRYGSLRAAIGEAAFMCSLERNPDVVKLAAYAPLFANAQHTVWTPNLIYPTTDGVFASPSWNVQRLFGAYRGDEVLDIKVDTTTFTTVTEEPWCKGNFTNVIEKVQASAVRTKEGEIIVKIVNTAEEPQQVKLNLAGAAKRIVFTGKDRDAHNTPSEPNALAEVADEVSLGPDGIVLAPLSLTVLAVGK